MFETAPDFEHQMPPGIAAHNAQFWHALKLTGSLPWYLAAVRATDGVDSIVESVAIAWESTLYQLLIDPQHDVLYLQVVERMSDWQAGWRVRDIVEAWQPTTDEATATGALIFRFNQREGLFSSDQQAVRDRKDERRLLFRRDSLRA